jgi:hypothetical protein
LNWNHLQDDELKIFHKLDKKSRAVQVKYFLDWFLILTHKIILLKLYNVLAIINVSSIIGEKSFINSLIFFGAFVWRTQILIFL